MDFKLVWTRGACRPLGRGLPDLSVSEICEEQMCLNDALELARACGYFLQEMKKVMKISGPGNQLHRWVKAQTFWTLF